MGVFLDSPSPTLAKGGGDRHATSAVSPFVYVSLVNKCGRMKRAKCKLCPNFLGVWPLMNNIIISSTVPPAVHPASAPPSLPPGKRAQGEGHAPELHPVFSAGNCQSYGRKLGV